MKKCEGIFDRYKFDGKDKKILLKNVKGTNKFHVKEAYFDALQVPYLIGNLAVGQTVKFLCNSIDRKRIRNPKWVQYEIKYENNHRQSTNKDKKRGDLA